ncbi:MAG: metallophosphoesterase [Clostridia bacterium]|nr:metallophosphoesterase [Clostridia bacterium]
MIKIQTSLIWPGCAQGKYVMKAKGCMLAVLRWGNAESPLTEWRPFAYIPIDPAGNGSFSFPGRRGIPRKTTHVWARCYAKDFVSYEDVSAEIPAAYLPTAEDLNDAHHFSVLTDLHLAARPWIMKRALRAAESDTILLLGDATNDGLPEQFSQFMRCIADSAPDKIILPVPGIHDITHPRFCGKEKDGITGYARFQKALLDKASEKGCSFSCDPCSLAG